MEETLHMIIYDIEDNRIRYKIAEVCKDYGLDRIQLSVFAGMLAPEKRKKLFDDLKSKLGKETFGRIILVPICHKDIEKKLEIIEYGKSVKKEFFANPST
jgi:CRISPR-associated protein Cas2